MAVTGATVAGFIYNYSYSYIGILVTLRAVRVAENEQRGLGAKGVYSDAPRRGDVNGSTLRWRLQHKHRR